VIHAKIILDGEEMGKNIEIGSQAPDFALVDIRENQIHLSDYEGKKTILLLLIRGFA
jgi:peroxiredoxin